MIGNKEMKWMICSLMLAGLALTLAAAGKVEISVEPQPVRTGEEAYLVIRSLDGARNHPLSGRLPKVDGLNWLSGTMQSSQIRIVNGRRSSVYELKIPFTVSRPGSYTIPSMSLTRSKERTKKVAFEAVEARYRTPGSSPSVRRSVSASNRAPDNGGELTLEQIMFMETEIPGRRPFYYLGEEIPLEVNIYVLEGIRPQLTWPRITFGDKGNAVFRDHKQSNPENPDFAGMTPRQVRRNGRDYVLYSFRTALRPIAASKLEIKVDENAALIVPDNRRRSMDPFDDIFGDSFFARTRQVARDLSAGPLTVEVRNPPPVPEGVRFTGLVGNWESQITLSPPPYKVGEPITLKVGFQGSGAVETLRSWPLELKGFRVYPPEMEKSAGSAEIRYVLIPTEPSEGKTENVSFGPYAVFRNGEYQVKEFRRAIPIARGSAVIPGNAGAYTVETPEAVSDGRKAKEEEPRRKAEDILYLKKSEGRGVPLPPEVNIAGGVLIAAAGLLFFVASLFVRLIRRARENDPDHQRKVSARSRKRALLTRLKKMDPEEIPVAVSGELASFLADARGLPPGADLSECAASFKADSPELAKMLSEVEQAAWMPSMRSRFTPDFRDALVKALRRLALAILLGCVSGPLLLSAAEEEKIKGPDQAMSAYDLGKFAAAEKYYRSNFDPAAPSANLLYNIGNCLYQQGYLPQAMLCFERASRLAPRDPDVLENLNLTRRKLMLPEKYHVEKPSDILPYLRDSLRPDEWLLVFCFGIALLFVAGGLAVLRGAGTPFRCLLGAGLLLAVLALTAYFSQRSTSYDPDFAVVTVKNLPVYSLPSDQGKVEMKLHPGEEVVIVERRLDWVRIRSGSAEGWVRARAVSSLWRPDSMADI